MELQFPFNGRSDMLSDSKQEPGTTARAKNVAGFDAASGRMCGAQVPGLTKVAADPLNGSNIVRLLAEVVHESATFTYTALGNSSTVDWSTASPGSNDIYAIEVDAKGDVYVLDGPNRIVKYNPDGVKQWMISLPAPERNAVCRALVIDDLYRVFAAISTGGDVKKSRIWAYEQLADNKTELLWEEEVEWFTESLWLGNDGLTLYCGQNDPTTWQSRVLVYTGIGVDSPTVLKEWNVPYPLNWSSVSSKDGSVVVSHEPLANRGFAPKSPESTAAWEDWTIRDLTSVEKRLWCWLSSMDVDGDDTNNANHDDGDIITEWIDKSGNDRNAVALGTGPTLRKGVIANKDALFFNGTSQAMQGAAGISTDFLYRQLNKGLVPCHAKHQFVVFALVRAAQATTRGTVFAANHTTSANVKDRHLQANATYNSLAHANFSGSAFLYEEVPPLAGPTAGAWGRLTGASNNVPLGGAFDADGLCLYTYVFDNGVDDVASVPTRSCLRINGRPVDRWTSDTVYATLQAAALGANNYAAVADFFQGDLLEFVALSDWYETSSGSSTAYTQQRLIEMPTYPDSVFAGGSLTEIEKIEGWLMHRRGAAHKLPSGHEATLEATATPNNNDTVTVNVTTYTFKTTLSTGPAVANEVLIGGSAAAAMRNLHHAINGSGARGTAYGSPTVAHASVWSPGVLADDGTNFKPACMVQAREARNTTGFALAESTSEARLIWLPVSGATTVLSVRSRTASATEPGIYPHPFFLFKTADSAGGPPSTTAIASLASGLSSAYGMLTKWDPVSGKLKNVLTTSGPGFAALGFGGLGYGHVVLSDGSIVCTGPRQAAVSVLSVSADNVDIRKVVDTDTGFVVTDGATALLAWTAAPGAQTYQYPRLARDDADNAYVPIFQGSNGTSAAVYKKIAASASLNSALLYTVTSLTDDPKAHAIAVDPKYPSFPAAFTDPRAERFYLATRKETGNTTTIYAIRQITAATTGATPRAIKRVAVCGGNLYQVNVGSSATLLASALVSSAPRFLDAATFQGDLFIVDGVNSVVYRPTLGTQGAWRALRGQIPLRPMLVERYVKRLYLGAFGDDRYGWACSQYGDPFGWDFDPPGDSPLAVAAIHSDTSLLGGFGDPLTCLCANQDDLMIVGGDHSISMLRGDPAQGGRFDELVHGIGIAFGRARCFLPDGRFFFLTNQAELYSLVIGQQPKLLSRRIQRDLANSINFSTARPELAYNPLTRSIEIRQMVHGSPSASLTHWNLELDNMALWPRTFGSASVSPTAMHLVDGDAPADRAFWYGCGDGRIRYVDPSAGSDDGVRIDSEVFLDAPEDEKMPVDYRFEDLEVLMDGGAGVAAWEFLASHRPDLFSTAKASGSLIAGRNRLGAVRVTAPWAGVLIKGASSPLVHWALNRATIRQTPMREQVGS